MNPMKTLPYLMTASQAVPSLVRQQLAVSLLAFVAGLSLAQPCTATPGEWDVTDSLHTARSEHTATLLSGGRVLVVGGYFDRVQRSAELYDSATGTWTDGGRLNASRSGHTATLLLDGRVLVAGGYNDFRILASAELYDPATGTWTTTGPLNSPRAVHTATLLG